MDLCNFGVACWKCVSVPVAEKLIIALQLVQVKPCLVSGYLWLDIIYLFITYYYKVVL